MPTPEADYLMVAPDLTVHHTVEVRPDVQVDVDSAGRVVGVERIGGQVDLDALAAVLRTVRMEG